MKTSRKNAHFRLFESFTAFRLSPVGRLALLRTSWAPSQYYRYLRCLRRLLLAGLTTVSTSIYRGTQTSHTDTRTTANHAMQPTLFDWAHGALVKHSHSCYESISGRRTASWCCENPICGHCLHIEQTLTIILNRYSLYVYDGANRDPRWGSWFLSASVNSINRWMLKYRKFYNHRQRNTIHPEANWMNNKSKLCIQHRQQR